MKSRPGHLRVGVECAFKSDHQERLGTYEPPGDKGCILLFRASPTGNFRGATVTAVLIHCSATGPRRDWADHSEP